MLSLLKWLIFVTVLYPNLSVAQFQHAVFYYEDGDTMCGKIQKINDEHYRFVECSNGWQPTIYEIQREYVPPFWEVSLMDDDHSFTVIQLEVEEYDWYLAKPYFENETFYWRKFILANSEGVSNHCFNACN